MNNYDNGQFRLRCIKCWGDARGAMSIVTEEKDGSLLYNFIPGQAGSLNRQRRGSLLPPR